VECGTLAALSAVSVSLTLTVEAWAAMLVVRDVVAAQMTSVTEAARPGLAYAREQAQAALERIVECGTLAALSAVSVSLTLTVEAWAAMLVVRDVAAAQISSATQAAEVRLKLAIAAVIAAWTVAVTRTRELAGAAVAKLDLEELASPTTIDVASATQTLGETVVATAAPALALAQARITEACTMSTTRADVALEAAFDEARAAQTLGEAFAVAAGPAIAMAQASALKARSGTAACTAPLVARVTQVCSVVIPAVLHVWGRYLTMASKSLGEVWGSAALACSRLLAVQTAFIEPLSIASIPGTVWDAAKAASTAAWAAANERMAMLQLEATARLVNWRSAGDSRASKARSAFATVYVQAAERLAALQLAAAARASDAYADSMATMALVQCEATVAAGQALTASKLKLDALSDAALAKLTDLPSRARLTYARIRSGAGTSAAAFETMVRALFTLAMLEGTDVTRAVHSAVAASASNAAMRLITYGETVQASLRTSLQTTAVLLAATIRTSMLRPLRKVVHLAIPSERQPAPPDGFTWGVSI